MDRNVMCHCMRCDVLIENPKHVRWLELSADTGLYHAEGTLPHGETSQGMFPFGRRCARKTLENGGQS